MVSNFDPNHMLENNNELKFSRDQSFFDKSPAVRLGIGILFVLAVFFTLHFREVPVEILELNSIAPDYEVAQTDFDFYDEEATIIIKQEAVRDIGRIYQLSDKEIRQERVEFENFLMYNQDWRKDAGESSFEQIYNAIDTVEKALTQVRFTDPRTYQKIRELKFPSSHYIIYTPTSLTEEILLPQSVWTQIGETAFPNGKFQGAAETFIIGYFATKTWGIEEDITAQRNLRQKIQSNVEDRYTHVRAGSRIIDQGDRVTARHVAMLQAMKHAMRERRNLWHPLTLGGSLLMALLLTGISIAYIRFNQPQVLTSNRKLSLLVTIMILTFIIAKTTEFFLLGSSGNLIEVVRYPLFVPFAAILICSLMNANIATFGAGLLTVILTLSLAYEPRGFMFINLAVALVAILCSRSLQRRKEILIVCLKSWLCAVVIIFALNFYDNTLWSVTLLTDILCAGVFMLLSAILIVGLLPLLESGFKIMTDVTLMEYMDPNNDLLRRLSIEAPGTYQHSVVVGNLAEAAACSINANGLFCRVATLYHDIGKIVTPQYFTENQQAGMNIHQLLTPIESSHVIIAHVAEGVVLARRAGLPEQFIDIIKEHHGTTLAYYFYRKQLEKVGGDRELIDESEFRYGGPTPRSKESAIIMIADSLEAASRSLENVNEETLSELATRLIKDKADDGQFDHCLLTFEELAIVKATLIKTLVAYSHSRVKYPLRERPSESSASIAPSAEA